MNNYQDPLAGISLNDIPDSDDNYDLIPNGEYGVRAVDMQLRESKNRGQHGNFGQMIAVQFEVTGPTQAGRKIFANFNIVNDNATATEIGLRELKSWMAACGADLNGPLSMDRVYECVGREFIGRIGVQKSKNPEYDDQNKIAKYKAHPMTAQTKQAPAAQQAQYAEYSAPAQQAAPPAPAPQQTAPAPGARPWERK